MPTATGDERLNRLKEIKTILRSLLISAGKIDVTLPRLNGMFREEEDENIPYRQFNYPNLQEFLYSMPDVMTLRYNREQVLCAHHVDTEKSAHVSSLVAKQRKPHKRAKYNVSYKPRNSYGNSYSNYSRPPIQRNTMTTLDSLRQVLQDLRNSPKTYQRHNGIRKSDILQKLNARSYSSINSIQALNAKLDCLKPYLVIDNDYVYFKEDVLNSNSGPANYSNQNLQVRSAPIQNPVQKFTTNQPATAYNQTAPSFRRDEKPPTAQTNSSQMSRPVQSDKPLYTANNERTEKSASFDCKNAQVEQGTNERIRFRLKKLIEKHPEGIWAADLPYIYKEEYSIDLDYHEFGFNSITEFIATMPELLKITNPDETGRHMIVDARIQLDNIKSEQPHKSLASYYNYDDFIANSKEPVPNKLSASVCQKFIPEGMMGLDESVEPISVTSFSSEEFYEVNISEIFTPSFFWVTLRKNKSKIKKLMEDLGEFYKQQNLDACRLPQALIETGLNVACVYANMWHRAIIQKVKPDGYVMVLFFDYGTVKTYNPNHLYYLHKKFSALPAQALACGLHNIKAPHGDKQWTHHSTTSFVNKVWDVPLIATVCEINEENNTMMVALTDTSDDTVDLHLDVWMIENGLADRGKMENPPSNRHRGPTYGVPLDKLCMYDEDYFKRKIEEHEKSLKKKEAPTKLDYASVKQADLQDVDSASSYIADSSFVASSIATLVRENIDLTKQTNTITQAILSNMPINKSEISNLKCKETPAVAKSRSDINPSIDSCSEAIKRISLDLNRKLSTINNNFSEIIKEPSPDLFKTGSMYFNHNSNRGTSVVSDSFSSGIDRGLLTKHSSPVFSDHRASNQSLYSHQSNSDYSQCTNSQNQENNNNQDYDRLSNANFEDGTLTFRKSASCPNTNQTQKQPSYVNSVNNINNNPVINGKVAHGTSDWTKESDDGYQTAPITSSSQTTLPNISFKAKTYTSIQLTSRCFNKTIHLFHLDNEGWLAVNEFIDCFTNVKINKILFKLLTLFNVDVNYKYLSRDNSAQLFSQLDKSQMKLPRESSGRIKEDFNLQLLPMRQMLHILAKLDFVDPKVFKEATILLKQNKEDAEEILFERFNNRILYDALNLLIQYREFKRSLMSVN